MDTREKDLLETFQTLAGCDYLSDLHSNLGRAAVRRVAAQVRTSDYSLMEWNEAVSYIMQEKSDCKSVGAARQRLMQKEKNK